MTLTLVSQVLVDLCGGFGDLVHGVALHRTGSLSPPSPSERFLLRSASKQTLIDRGQHGQSELFGMPFFFFFFFFFFFPTCRNVFNLYLPKTVLLHAL
jgi:hypothetical protein